MSMPKFSLCRTNIAGLVETVLKLLEAASWSP